MRNLNKLIISSITIGMISISTLNSPTYIDAQSQQNHSVEHLKWIDTTTIPHNQSYKGTTVGGLSGISYDAKNNNWYLASDDRSEKSPARFYEAKINYNQHGFKHTKFTNVHTFKQPDGSSYPNKNKYQHQENQAVADIESIRIDPITQNILYTSEGDRSLGLNPFIREADLTGQFLADIPITNNIKMDKDNKHGFRNNLALEGSTFSTDGQSIWTSMEGSLLQDGQISTTRSGSFTRITQYNRNGELISEYAYPLDAVPGNPGANKTAENGISEMLAINNHEFLALERASVQTADGAYHNYVRIYKFDTKNATEIKNMDSIKDKKIKPVHKQLVANLNEQDIGKIDNIEGMTFGKQLPNGNDSLVLVTDNNFNQSQKTELIAFEVQPEDKSN